VTQDVEQLKIDRDWKFKITEIPLDERADMNERILREELIQVKVLNKSMLEHNKLNSEKLVGLELKLAAIEKKEEHNEQRVQVMKQEEEKAEDQVKTQ
jgi:hypothetical protein